MKVLVTGSEGFLGRHLCPLLEKAGHEVHHFDVKNDHIDQDIIKIDADYLEENKIEAVCHLAALVGLKKCYEKPLEAVMSNLYGTTNLLEACKKYGKLKKFIHTSTWAVKGKLENPYDITKLAGENMVKSFHTLHGLPAVVLRLGTMFGVGMSDVGVIPTYVRLANEGKPLVVQGRGEQIRQFTWVEDVADAFVRALDKGKIGETYYIVAKEVVSINDLAKTFGTEIEYKEARQGDEDYEIIDSTKAKEDFGWEPKMTLKGGIEKIREWKKEQQ